MRVGERLTDLRADLERGLVVDHAFAERLPQCAPGHVFIGDVDVTRVTRERIGALAARVAKAGGRGGLPFGPRGGLPLAGDDLERNLDAGGLVTGEPNRAVASASERLQRAIPAEDELVRGDGKSRF